MQHSNLDGSFLCRGPHSTGETRFENHVVTLGSTTAVFDGEKGPLFRSNLASKGGGTTDIELVIAPADFQTLLNIMIEANGLQSVAIMSLAVSRFIADKLQNSDQTSE